MPPDTKVPDVWIKTLKANRGSPRLYLDGLQAIRTGFAPGDRYDIAIEGKKLVLQKMREGSRTISIRRKGEREYPVLDINSSELLSIFEGMDAVRVVVSNGRVTFLPLASEAKRVERLERLQNKIASGQPLSTGSLAHGGGVLSHAIHRGLADAGIACDLVFANELRDDLLQQAIEHNDAWTENTGAIALPMQEAAQDDWLMERLPKLEILEAGIPCSGASIAGRVKGNLDMMEAHPEVGHLVFAALTIILRTQPAIVLIENVPRYRDSASAQILRAQFKDMGYVTHEALLSGKDFGCMEDRVRWCLVAVTRGVEFSFDALAPTVRLVRKLGDLLDRTIPLDDPSWGEVKYLKDKEVRNAEAGHRFKMQFIDEESTEVPTLRRFYNKGGSSDPRVRHPVSPKLSRLLTAAEHAAIKDVPPSLIAGLSETTAHQLLGQGIVYEPFRAVGERLGQCLLRLAHPAPRRGEDDEPAEPSAAVSRRQRMTG